jgi:hypothetical protein
MGIKHGTVNFYNMMVRHERSQTLLSPDHEWYPYKQKLDKMLKEITEKTGIRDFSSSVGQAILASVNNFLNRQNASYAKDYEEVVGWTW